jgi:hypothetical protein
VPGSVSRVLALGVAVVTPLALSLLPTGERRSELLLRGTAFLQPVAALACLASLTQPVGPWGGATALWLGVSLLAGVVGAVRLLDRRGVLDVCFAAGLGYLSVAGVWTSLSRLGVAPFDLDPVIVSLTAVHFHFAGLAAPIAVGRLGEWLRVYEPRWSRPYVAVAASAVLGQPMVATGLLAAPIVGLVGALTMAIGLGALAVLTMVGPVRRGGGWLERTLFIVSSVSVLGSMPLAVAWAWGNLTGDFLLDLEWMVRLHGMANAHGFALCGLLAWSLSDPPREPGRD